MTPHDRKIRARIYDLLMGGASLVDVAAVAESGDWDVAEVARSFRRLESAHRVALKGDRVWMAHPFSGVPTAYRAVVDYRSWHANCAWDALAILALLGDGEAHGPEGHLWSVRDGVVSPDGVVHFLVPARQFWDDIGFT